MKLTKENNAFHKHTRLGALEKEQEQFEIADKSEVIELKNRMKVLMNKFNAVKKDKENL